MTLAQALLAKKFQAENNLDMTDEPAMIKHDYIHALLGLGVSIIEEELVNDIELYLEFKYDWMSDQVKFLASQVSF